MTSSDASIPTTPMPSYHFSAPKTAIISPLTAAVHATASERTRRSWIGSKPLKYNSCLLVKYFSQSLLGLQPTILEDLLYFCLTTLNSLTGTFTTRIRGPLFASCIHHALYCSLPVVKDDVSSLRLPVLTPVPSVQRALERASAHHTLLESKGTKRRGKACEAL